MKTCELCEMSARMHCESDEASLCWDCDAKVHGANFLVARHCRTLLCQVCQAPTPWRASGASPCPTVSVCERCLLSKRKGADSNGDDDEDNQVVPLATSSSAAPPPVSSSSDEDEDDEDESSDDEDDRRGFGADSMIYAANFHQQKWSILLPLLVIFLLSLLVENAYCCSTSSSGASNSDEEVSSGANPRVKKRKLDGSTSDRHLIEALDRLQRHKHNDSSRDMEISKLCTHKPTVSKQLVPANASSSPSC